MIDRAQIDADCDAAIGHLLSMAEGAFRTYGPPSFEDYRHQIRQAFAIGWISGNKQARTTQEVAE